MKKVAAVLLFALAVGFGCESDTFQQKTTTYGSGLFYGIEPANVWPDTKNMVYAIRDTLTKEEIAVVDKMSSNTKSFTNIKDIYRKEDLVSWQQRPVLVHYMKVNTRWWPGKTAADSTKGDIRYREEYLLTGFSYVPLPTK